MALEHAAALGGTASGALDRVAMARTLSYLYLAGATLGTAALLLPHGAEVNQLGVAVVMGVGYAVGGCLLVFAEVLPRAVVPLFLALGSGLITLAIWFDGHGTSEYTLFYPWVAIEASYFLSRRAAALQLGLAGACYAAVLALLPGALEFQHWLLTIGTGLVTGGLVSYQRGRIDTLMASLADAGRTDQLTGLPNRRALECQLELELERARGEETRVSVLLGDLDGFKLVNERYGQELGDSALRMVARDLRKWKRRVDTPGRMGGEEFALVMPGTDGAAAFLVAERLRRAVERSFADLPVEVTISFGVATYPEHARDAGALLRAADRALYTAKELGRDRTAVYNPEVARVLARAAEPHSAELQLAPLLALAEALDVRDYGSAEHSLAVGRYARMIAAEFGLAPERIERVRLAGVLHDIGKIAAVRPPRAGGMAPGEDDWRGLRTHPEIGAELLASPHLSDLREWVLCHHERPDGSGYPRGLSGERIPLEASILTVADAYESLARGRADQPSLGDEAARSELRAGAGSRFDATVVDALVAALDRERAAELAATPG